MLDLISNTYRECDFYLKYLGQFSHTDITLNDEPINEYKHAINDEISYLNFDCKDIKKMKNEFIKTQQISADKLNWLKSDDGRPCNWAWCYLQSRIRNELLRNNLSLSDHFNKVSVYFRGETLNISFFRATPSDMNCRYDSIIKSLECSELSIDFQLKLIDALKDVWVEVFDKNGITTWFDSSSKNQADWIWNYIEKRPLTRLRRLTWTPISTNERKLAVIAFFDVMFIENPDKIKLLLHEMKKAWSQKKFRDKNKDKKPYSINMTQETKNKLDQLVKHKELKITELFEQLINKEYKEYFKS